MDNEFISNIQMNYHLSDYFIKTELDDSDYLFYSCMSGSIIKLTPSATNALLNFQLNYFTKDELTNLIEMGFITNRNELDDLQRVRNRMVETHEKQSLGLTILTTTVCNARCPYCFEHGIGNKTLTRKTADKIIPFILNNFHDKPMHISWFGGEPLLNYEIIDYISNQLHENNITFNSTMTSNGYLIDQITLDSFKNWNLERVQITLDGIGPEYDKVKNYSCDKNAFPKIIANITRLLESGIKVSIRINFDPLQIEKALHAIDWIYQRFGSENPLLSLYVVNIVDHNVVSVNNLPHDENNPLIRLYDKLFKYGYVTDLQKLGFSQKICFCGIYYNYYIINADGGIFKCEHTCNDENEVLGNIEDMSIDKIKERKWVDTALPSKECEKCAVLPCCQGNCKTLISEFGLKSICMPTKYLGEKLLKLYYDYRRQ